MLAFFINVSLMEFQARYLALFLLFSVIDGFEWFWMERLHKDIQLMLGLLKAPFLGLYVSCYTLMTFLMMLSVILSCSGVVVITTAQLHSNKPEIRFSTGANPAHSMSEIRTVRMSENGAGWK